MKLNWRAGKIEDWHTTAIIPFWSHTNSSLTAFGHPVGKSVILTIKSNYEKDDMRLIKINSIMHLLIYCYSY